MFRALFSVNPKWVQKGQKILQKGINDMSVRYKQQAFIHNMKNFWKLSLNSTPKWVHCFPLYLLCERKARWQRRKAFSLILK